MTTMNDGVTFRPATVSDAEVLSTICYEAFRGISGRHGFPADFPSTDVARGLFEMILNHPAVHSVVAERDGRIIGSNFLWEDGPIGGVGPITVDAGAQAKSVGRRLMQAVLDRAQERGLASVRLCQAAFNTISFSLYTKLGFDVREPLSCIQSRGEKHQAQIPGYHVRPATQDDIDACDDICRRVHGHTRTGELTAAVARGAAQVVERHGQVTGYSTEIGFFGHAVGLTNWELMALIGAARQITGPGLLLPSRNGEVLRWCLSHGLVVVQPLTLMSTGLYNEPSGAFLPSILY